MPSDTCILSWLEHLWQLYPAQGVLVVGAGNGTSPWIDALQRWNAPSVTLVEADDAQFQHLQRNMPEREGWQLRKQVVAAETGNVTYYQASSPGESGLVEPENLRALWPNLKTRQKSTRQAISLAELMALTEPQANWLLLDCLPAGALLAGAGDALATCDVIVTRALLPETGADLPSAQADANTITQLLQAQGFCTVAMQTSQHPGVGHTLHVRDRSAQLAQLNLAFLQSSLQVKRLNDELSETQEALQQVQKASQQSAQKMQDLLAVRDASVQSLQRELLSVQEQLSQTVQALATMSDMSTLKSLMTTQQISVQAMAQQIGQLDLSGALNAQLNKQLSGGKQNLKEVETRLRNDLNKGLSNAVKQMEAFLRIQSFLGTADALGDFHGWPISPDIGLFLLDRMREQHYDLIIEFGSGTSTALFAKAVEVLAEQAAAKARNTDDRQASSPSRTEIISFEHDAVYHTKTTQMLKARGLDHCVRLVHAPLVEWRDGDQTYLYYDCQSTLSGIAQQHAHRQLRILLLVDGPPGATCPNARYPAVPFVFNALGVHQIDVVLDDASRLEEKQVVELWRAYWQYRSIQIADTTVATEKGCYFSTSPR